MNPRASTLGRYHLVQRIGQGGMAAVSLAVTEGLPGMNKLLVVKELLPEHANDPRLVQLFFAEARLAARLNHPNTVQTFDAGREKNRCYLVMERLEGVSLHRVLHGSSRRLRPLALRHQLSLACQALDGLHHFHNLRDWDGTPLEPVHRDVSPENLVVTFEGMVKVVDFGLALTATSPAGEIVGKATYMAPEQARGERIDRRADVFSVGVILWEMATGARLWGALDSAEILLHLRMGNPIPSPSSVQPSVAPELERIVTRALAVDASDRYPSAEALAADLREHLGPPDTEAVAHWMADAFADERRQMEDTVRGWFAGPRTSVVPAPERTASESPPVTPHVTIQETRGSLRDTVAGLCQLEGVVAAAVVHRDGTVRAMVTNPPLKSSAFAAALQRVVASDEVNRTLSAGPSIRSLTWLQLERGWLLVRRVPNGLVAVLANRRASEALVRVGMNAAILKMVELGPAPAQALPAQALPDEVVGRLAGLVAPHVGPLAAVLVRRTVSELGGPGVLRSRDGQHRLAVALVRHVQDERRRSILEHDMVVAMNLSPQSS